MCECVCVVRTASISSLSALKNNMPMCTRYSCQIIAKSFRFSHTVTGCCGWCGQEMPTLLLSRQAGSGYDTDVESRFISYELGKERMQCRCCAVCSFAIFQPIILRAPNRSDNSFCFKFRPRFTLSQVYPKSERNTLSGWCLCYSWLSKHSCRSVGNEGLLKEFGQHRAAMWGFSLSAVCIV